MSDSTSDRDLVLSPDDYNDALTVQNASNFSGVLKSFFATYQSVTEEYKARGDNAPHAQAAHHPIVRMYVEQLYHLAVFHGGMQWNDAYKICQERSQQVEDESENRRESAYC